MCHTEANAALPLPDRADMIVEAGITAFTFGSVDASRRIVLIPDIYGTTPFYRGLATWFAKRDASVWLVDPFAEFGELPQPTKEAAFARRHKVRDLSYVDALERFIRGRQVSGVVGFCLGGLFVFDLARRGVSAGMVSLYGFPQGMPNQDPLPIPFDYLEGLPATHTAVFGEADYLQTPESLERLKTIAHRTPSFSVKIYPKSGHGFLADLGSEDPVLRANAQDALLLCGNILAPCRDAALH